MTLQTAKITVALVMALLIGILLGIVFQEKHKEAKRTLAATLEPIEAIIEPSNFSKFEEVTINSTTLTVIKDEVTSRLYLHSSSGTLIEIPKGGRQ